MNMTEAEWLACTEPQRMLTFLGGRITDRKLRLFAVACCRRIWSLLPGEQFRHLVELSERYADREVSRRDLMEARQLAEGNSPPGWDAAAVAAVTAALRQPYSAACQAQRAAATAAANAQAHERLRDPNRVPSETCDDVLRRAILAEFSEQSVLLRDLCGNPFGRPPRPFAWLTPATSAIAQTIYYDRRFEDLPVLGDALEDGGCTEQDFLEHCRSPGPHVRGCWVVDHLLGKP